MQPFHCLESHPRRGVCRWLHRLRLHTRQRPSAPRAQAKTAFGVIVMCPSIVPSTRLAMCLLLAFEIQHQVHVGAPPMTFSLPTNFGLVTVLGLLPRLVPTKASVISHLDSPPPPNSSGHLGTPRLHYITSPPRKGSSRTLYTK